MRKMQFIIVPKQVLLQTENADLKILSEANSKFLSKLMLFPIKLKPVNAYFDSTQRIVQEIKEHYATVGVVGGTVQPYAVMQRNESGSK